MSNYTPTTLFGPKDSLPPTNPAKTIFGAAYDVEFANIATAIASKLDASGGVVTSIAGTANQIVASASVGAVTLSLPSNVTIAGTLTANSFTGVGATISGNVAAATGTFSGTVSALTVDGTGTPGSVNAGVFGTLAIGDNIGLLNPSANLYTTGTNPLSIGTQGAANVNIYSGGSNRIFISSAGSVQVQPISGGDAFSVVSGVDLAGMNITGSQNNISLTLNNTKAGATANWRISSSATGSGFGAGSLVIGNASNAYLQILSSGACFVGVPASAATALTVTALTTSSALTLTASGNATNGVISFNFDGSGNSFIESQTPNTTLGIGSFQTGTAVSINTNGANRLQIASTGAVTINAPSSGSQALTVNGIAGSFAAEVAAPNVASSSFGLFVQAGTNTTDSALQVSNAASTQTLFRIVGDGGVLVGAATGGSLGLGFLNIANGLALAGNPIYAGVPVNNQAGSYTAVLADANKQIVKTGAGAATITIPANSSVAFPIGTLITIHCSVGTAALSVTVTTDTLIWAQTGSLTSTRALAAAGLCTLTKINATSWVIAGTGVS